jgi:hypothetical protein
MEAILSYIDMAPTNHEARWLLDRLPLWRLPPLRSPPLDLPLRSRLRPLSPRRRWPWWLAVRGREAWMCIVVRFRFSSSNKSDLGFQSFLLPLLILAMGVGAMVVGGALLPRSVSRPLIRSFEVPIQSWFEVTGGCSAALTVGQWRPSLLWPGLPIPGVGPMGRLS